MAVTPCLLRRSLLVLDRLIDSNLDVEAQETKMRSEQAAALFNQQGGVFDVSRSDACYRLAERRHLQPLP